MISTGEDNFFFFHRTPVLELWMLTSKALNYFILQLIKGVTIIVFNVTGEPSLPPSTLSI